MPPRWRIGAALDLQAIFDKAVRTHTTGIERGFHASYTQNAEITPLRKQLKDATKKARRDTVTPHKSITVESTKFSDWELTVGIEIHAQLNTIRKLFSRARPDVEGIPNSSLAPFDVALPGSQPRFQLHTLIPALRAAIALNCQVQPISRFDRKHYFYHDQPSGYQITQYYQPFARDGSITLTAEDGLPAEDGKELVVGIKQIQMEQDTAKTQELEDGSNSIDFTRSGQPLVEIISLPQIHSPKAAAAYLRKIQAILFAVDSVTTGMELGGLRADVNVSVRRSSDSPGSHSYSGVSGLGQRTEIKNLSSFKAVEDAIEAERTRQINVLESGGRVEGETRGWSLTHPSETRRLRGKEGEVDYRYMPDPDIAPLRIGHDLVDYLRRTLPPVPKQLATMLVEHYGLTITDAKALLALDDGDRLVYYQEVVNLLPAASPSEKARFGRITGNWVLHELGALLSTADIVWTPELIPAKSLARIIQLQSNSKMNGASAKQVLRMVFDGSQLTIDEILTKENLWFEPMSADELRGLAMKVIEAHKDVADSIRGGSSRKVSFLVGLIMKTGDRNRIDAKQAEAVLQQLLSG